MDGDDRKWTEMWTNGTSATGRQKGTERNLWDSASSPGQVLGIQNFEDSKSSDEKKA